MSNSNTSVTRKGFLAGTAGVIAGFPTVVHASVLGRGGYTAPSNRVTVGMIGTGKMATKTCWCVPLFKNLAQVKLI